MKSERTSSEWIKEGLHDEKVHNFYSANASFELAGEDGAYHREQFIRREARKNPVRGYCLLNKEDVAELKEYVAEQADRRKLNEVRKWINGM